MSGKILKLAFAMGGGVSLGAFSGAALTEAIKLALLRLAECRLNDTDAGYESVEIDVFSGASAGSLSLAVMLRALTWRSRSESEAAARKLAAEYPTLWPVIQGDEKLMKDLVAAQVAQDLQHTAWVKEIEMKQLLGNGDPGRRDALRHGPGLLDGEAVYRIARNLLIDGLEDAVWDRRLLSPRCLYACTLTSLTALTADSRDEFGAGSASMPGLRDALVSRFHNDMRIFDIHFKRTLGLTEAKESVERANDLVRAAQAGPESRTAAAAAELAAPTLPPRWYRLHDDEEVPDVAASISDKKTWAMLASTALASGAFPAAFPPVVITRESWEYGFRPDDPTAEHLNEASVWPKRLKELDVGQHPFAYIDGGVFNNDPVREAYRMVSFIDGHASSNDFLRRVLFVDPSVGPEGEVFRVGGLSEFGTVEDGSLTNLGSPAPTRRLTTLPRLLGLVGGLVSIVLEQGRTREADGVLTTRDNFVLRDRFRAGARNLLAGIPPEVLRSMAGPFWSHLNEGCNLIFEGWANQLIPAGASNVAGELRRILREESLPVKFTDAETYVKDGPGADGLSGTPADWLLAHLALYFDLVLGLEGKRDSARLIAITPYQKLDGAMPEPLKLLGAPISAFTGFFSRAAREHDFRAGRFCADLFLGHDAASTDGPRLLPVASEGRVVKPPKHDKSLREAYAREIAEWAPRLRDRLEEVVEKGLPGVFSPLVPWVLKKLVDIDGMVAGLVEERFSPGIPGEADDDGMSIELIMLVPPGLKRLEIARRGHGMADEPVRQLYVFGAVHSVLATSVRFVPEGRGRPAAWDGGAVRDGDHIRIDKDGLGFGYWALVKLPSPGLWKGLARESRTHLRPVLKLDLQHYPEKGGHEVAADSAEWKIGEAAVPLVDTLLRGSGSDG